jgi:uncharacterized protein
MHVLIAGGTGFLGHHLTTALLDAGHHVTILTRRPVATGFGPGVRSLASRHWSPDGTLGDWADSCGTPDVIVNLAGESIGSARWSQARKAVLQSSRLLPTRTLAAFIRQSAKKPSVFVSASAVGYYGEGGEAPLTEDAPAGQGFLAELARAWEEEAAAVAGGTTRVILVRTGVVFDARDGALARMLLPFRLGLGGPMGSGRQYVPWIDRDDWVALVVWLISASGLTGPVNATAPSPVTSAGLAAALGRVLRRPTFVQTPAWALKLLLGEMAGPLLLTSQRVIPARALEHGFGFRHAEIEGALRARMG